MTKQRKQEQVMAALLVMVLVLTMVPVVVVPAWAAPTELFFSEYIEGLSYNKALEIYNGTGATVDLAAGGYNIHMSFNGGTSTYTIDLTGSVADGDVYVVVPTNATDPTILAQADQLQGTSWFNGDDAVVLLKGTTILDVIGQIGYDPGSEWGAGLTSTADNTLRRKASIEAGDPDGSNLFDPAIEWDGYATDTFDGLGSHSIGGGSDYTPIYDIQYTTDPSGASPYLGQEVTTEGIVTAVFDDGYFIEDPAGGPWNGLWVYGMTNVPVLGDRLRLTGTVEEYYGLTELADLTLYEVESSGNPLPDQLLVTTGAANDEQYEGVLIRVENVTVTAEEDPYGEWEVDDGSGPLAVDNLGTDTYVPVLGDELAAVIGPLNYSYGAFKIAPRDDDDIILPGLDYLPIYDIQYTEDPSGASPYLGQEVTTEGIVTA
ncbi:MAG: lamin tail domain-containing protein, partial [Anaerolineae bacterium]